MQTITFRYQIPTNALFDSKFFDQSLPGPPSTNCKTIVSNGLRMMKCLSYQMLKSLSDDAQLNAQLPASHALHGGSTSSLALGEINPNAYAKLLRKTYSRIKMPEAVIDKDGHSRLGWHCFVKSILPAYSSYLTFRRRPHHLHER